MNRGAKEEALGATSLAETDSRIDVLGGPQVCEALMPSMIDVLGGFQGNINFTGGFAN